MKKSLLVSVSLGAMFMFSGCATILSGTTEKISVNSNPSEVTFKLDNKEYTAPAIITVKRENEDRIITVDNSKCQKTILLNKKLNPVLFVNMLTSGGSASTGSTTDYTSGAMWKYDSNVNINCK